MHIRTRSPALFLKAAWLRVRTWLMVATGQGLVEYSMILMLIAVVVIGIFTLFGNDVSSMYSDVNSGLEHAVK